MISDDSASSGCHNFHKHLGMDLPTHLMSKLFARRDAIRTWIKAPEMVRRAHCDHVDPPTHPVHVRGVEGCGSCTSRKHEDHTDKSGMSSKYDHFLSHEAMASDSRAKLNCSLYRPFAAFRKPANVFVSRVVF